MVKRTFLLLIILLAVYEANVYTAGKLSFPELSVFTERNLYHYMRDIGIKYPRIVMAQAKIESGNFRSKLFRHQNNLFGMTYPGKKKTVAVGAKNGYNVYNSWQASVIDYMLWQARMIHRVKNEEAYLSYLQEHYAESEEYITLIRKIR